MNTQGLWTTVVVQDDERAFLTRNGRFERLLPPGRFSEFDPLAPPVVRGGEGRARRDRS